MRLIIAFFAILMFLPVIAQAQDLNTLLDIPSGETLVNLSATERVEVDQDLLISSLRYEAENKDAKKLQDDINTVMKAALDKAKSYPDVKVETQQYYVYKNEYYPNPANQVGKPISTWRGQQGLILKSKNAADVLKLTGELQEMKLAVNGLNYMVSPELLEETQNTLLEGALAKLTAKAERIAKALGKSKADLLNVNVDMGGYYPQPMMARAEMMSMDGAAAPKMDAPVAAPGQSDITLTVSATARIKP
jgi:predicted secreted protein